MSTLHVADASRTGRMPPLANGDWLKRDEFHRRYLAMSGLKKAELIRNTVFMPSPVNADRHGAPHSAYFRLVGRRRQDRQVGTARRHVRDHPAGR